MSNKDKIEFNLLSFIEAIEKIEEYSQTFDNGEDFFFDAKSFDANEIWSIITLHLIPIKKNIQILINTIKKGLLCPSTSLHKTKKPDMIMRYLKSLKRASYLLVPK